MSRNEEIGERLQLRRVHLNRRFQGEFTQEAVSEKLQELGVTIEPGSISHYETGRVRITAEVLIAFAKILQVPVQWFYGDEDTTDTFAGEVIAAFNDTPELSQEAKDHVLRTIRLLQQS